METTQQTTELKSILVKEYGLNDRCDIQKIKSGLSNDNYLVSDSQNKFVARIARFAVPNQTTNMVEIMLFAENNAIKIVPRLIKTATGRPYTHIENSPLFLMSFVGGESGKLHTLTAQKIVSAGKALAKFQSLSWQPESESKTLDPHHIFDIYNNFFPKLNDIQFPEKEYFLSMMEQESKYFLSKVDKIRTLPKGILHNDLIPENIMFKNEEVEAFIDLEEVGYGIMLLDLGRVLSYWFFNPTLNEYNTENAKIFLDAYETIRKLSEDEKNSLELVTRFIAFRHSVYVGKLLYEKKLQSICDIPDFQNFEYLINHKLSLFLFLPQ
jgi:homoserine kinase type II